MSSLLDVPWIADKEEYDEVVRWYELSQQGFTFKHISKLSCGEEGWESTIESRLERMYLAAVPVFLEAVAAERQLDSFRAAAETHFKY